MQENIQYISRALKYRGASKQVTVNWYEMGLAYPLVLL